MPVQADLAGRQRGTYNERMRTPALLVALALAAAALSACAHPTTVLLVRHAERDTSNPADRDPPLTADGAERARALATITTQTGVSAIYVTQFRRTQETALPSAEALHLTPDVFTVGADVPQHADAVVADILARHAGETVLVVGHSNTVPLIVERLGGAKPAIGEDEFDRLFEIVRRKDGSCEVTERRYGR